MVLAVRINHYSDLLERGVSALHATDVILVHDTERVDVVLQGFFWFWQHEAHGHHLA